MAGDPRPARATRRRAATRDGPRCRPDPDPRRARVRGRPPAPLRAAPARPPRAPPGAPDRARCRRAAGLRRGDPGGPRRGLDRGPGTGRLRRPAGRDHRAGRPQDADQRAQLGRPRVHGRPRGLAVADVGERRRRPGGAVGRRAPRRSTFDVARGQGVSAERRDRHARGPAARLAPRRVARCSSTACRSRPACSTSVSTCSTTAPRRCDAGAGRTSTCQARDRITRRGSGTRSSSTARSRSGSRAARSGRRS